MTKNSNVKQIHSVEDLCPDLRNPNRHTQRGQALTQKSIQSYGFGDSITTDKNGKVISGNSRTEILADVQMLDPIVVQSDGTRPIIHQRTDLDLDTDDRARLLSIALNRTAEVSLDWDPAILQELIGEGLDLSDLFFENELSDLLATLTEAEDGLLPDADPDAIPENVETRVKPGDVWLCGRHKIMCGDSTSATDVETLLDGAVPNLMITDPPYGVEYDANWRNEAMRADGTPFGAQAIGKVTNDDQCDWREAWILFPGEVIYCWHAGLRASEVCQSLTAVLFEIRSQIIWAKQHFCISRGHYHFKHEPCFYAVKKGATAHWIGDHKQTTLWEIDKPIKSETGHSTQKPVECMARPMRNHSGDVYDPFLGSGTTLIAAEQEGRICYGMEISPTYCDVILTRWEIATGKTALRK